MKKKHESLSSRLSGQNDPLARWSPDAAPTRTYYSQEGQDRWVVERVFGGEKYQGYFVEMGAADGILLSNTYVLEKDLAGLGYWWSPPIPSKDSRLTGRLTARILA